MPIRNPTNLDEFADWAECMCYEMSFFGVSYQLELPGFLEFEEADGYPENCPPKRYTTSTHSGEAYVDTDSTPLERYRGSKTFTNEWDWTDELNPSLGTSSTGDTYLEYDANELALVCSDLPESGADWQEVVAGEGWTYTWDGDDTCNIFERTDSTTLDLRAAGTFCPDFWGDNLKQICDYGSKNLKVQLTDEVVIADFVTEIDTNLGNVTWNDIKDLNGDQSSGTIDYKGNGGSPFLDSGGFLGGFTQSAERGVDAFIFSPMVNFSDSVTSDGIETKDEIRVSWEVVLRENKTRNVGNCDPTTSPTPTLVDDPDPEGTILDCVRYEETLTWNATNKRFQSKDNNHYIIVGDTDEAAYFIENMRCHRLQLWDSALTSPPTCINTWTPPAP